MKYLVQSYLKSSIAVFPSLTECDWEHYTKLQKKNSDNPSNSRELCERKTVSFFSEININKWLEVDYLIGIR